MCEPGRGAGVGLPGEFEELLVGSAVFDAVEFRVDKRAARGLVERVGGIRDPFSLEEVAGSEQCSVSGCSVCELR